MRLRYAAAVLLAAGCTSDPAPSPRPSPTGAEPGSKPWANALCADAWFAQGIVPKQASHTVDGHPTTVAQLLAWNDSGRGGNFGREAVRPTAGDDELAAVCVYTGEFGEAEGLRPPGPSPSSPPQHRSLMLFVYADGSPMSGVSLATTEEQFATPPPAPG